MVNRNRKILKRAALVVASALVSVVAAELIYRVLSPGPYAEPRILEDDGSEIPSSEIIAMLRTSGEGENGESPGPTSGIRGNLHFKICYDRPSWSYFDADGCIDVDINSLGFRDLEFAVKKKPDELRVLAIGDSFTFGHGVQGQDSWPQVLEGMLRSERKTPVEVINAGYAGGSWPPTYAAWLASDGIRFDPEVVVIGLCLNDICTMIPMMHQVPEPEPWLGGASKLLHQFQLWRAEKAHVPGDYRGFFMPLPQALRAQATPEQLAGLERWRQSWEQAKAGCLVMRDLLRSRDVRFVVAILPMLSRLGDDYPFLGLHEMVAEFCDTEGIEHVDLLPAFRHRQDTALWAHPTDQHPNDVGQRMIAQGIHDYLKL